MKVAAILHPSGLTAKELRAQLDARPDLVREQRLLSTDEEEIGTLTESGGGAAVVQRFSSEALDGVDILFLCGRAAISRVALAALPPGMRAVLMSLDATPEDAPPRVAGVNLGEGGSEAALPPVVLSPHPASVLLAHLLHPLRDLGLRRVEATLLQPVSVFGADALDQLFEQARNLLSFQAAGESTHWQRQLAFNLLAHEAGGESNADVVRATTDTLLGGAVAVSAQIVQAGVFHGLAASVHLACEPDPGIEALRDAYLHRPWVRWADVGPLGPTDAATTDDVLLGHLRAESGRPGSYWLWSVMDNLTRGGASNALAIAEALLR